jgi:hypothetical protein
MTTIVINIHTDVEQFITGTTEFAKLIYKVSMPSLDTFKYETTVQITEDFEEVDFEATPFPIFARIERSYESPLEYYYNTAAADVISQLETAYPGVTFTLGNRVHATQRVQQIIDDAYQVGDSANDAVLALQSSVNDAINGLNVALADHALENVNSLDAIDAAMAGKSNTGHGHSISDITGLEEGLDGKHPLITPGSAIADATNSTDVVARFNEVVAQLRAQGLTSV